MISAYNTYSGNRSVDAVRKGDSQENAEGGMSIAGPTPSHAAAGEWRGFVGTTTPVLQADEHPGMLPDFARTAVSRALNGRMVALPPCPALQFPSYLPAILA